MDLKRQPVVLDDVEISIEVEQDDLAVRGNALASGDDALDKKVEDEILRRLEGGDVWAWAIVHVLARGYGLTGEESLGTCSYEDENDFVEHSGCFPHLVAGACDDLKQQIIARLRKVEELV